MAIILDEAGSTTLDEALAGILDEYGTAPYQQVILDEAAGQALDEGGAPVLDESGGNLAQGIAPFTALPLLTATCVSHQEDLWEAYLAAYQAASDKWRQWRMMRQAGGTDGTAGFLFGQAYEAQSRAELAYEAWRVAQASAFPGAIG